LGGVPLSMTYDNLKAAVFKVLRGRNRIEQTNFINFRSHYLFDGKYCNTGRGNEIGLIFHWKNTKPIPVVPTTFRATQWLY
ncbi:MAG: hypothetical protein ACYC0Q_15995, partial [Eubacteriales bacterium]